MEEEHAVKAPLSDAFLQFLETNGLDPSIYTAIDSTPRYIRLKSGFESCIEEVEAEVKCKLEKLEWLLGFYSLPPHIQIAGSRAYREGKIYGIDVAFGAVVMAALNIQATDPSTPEDQTTPVLSPNTSPPSTPVLCLTDEKDV
ncbi:hypothetical protein glysoja_043435 [Glycine soja]|uniref:Uncharacterized protein n=1 Tax=Glycine soja TaxID=3848 RepID=A0A0B2RSP2_GLYSO|nr:hypothetical protein glysoja_043435 [Glycine soja]